jgi:hypothetical protein
VERGDCQDEADRKNEPEQLFHKSTWEDFVRDLSTACGQRRYASLNCNANPLYSIRPAESDELFPASMDALFLLISAAFGFGVAFFRMNMSAASLVKGPTCSLAVGLMVGMGICAPFRFEIEGAILGLIVEGISAALFVLSIYSADC